MLIKTDRKSVRALFFALGTGAAAGLVNGFLGAGGGILLLWMLSRVNPDKTQAGERDNFASVVAAVLPLCTVSAITYSGRGDFSGNMFFALAVPAAVGGVIGAYLTDRLNTAVLKAVFAVLVVIAGLNMMLR